MGKIKRSPVLFYSEDEPKEITKQWLEDKARIDASLHLSYPRDKDKEYERYLNNPNLSALFRHAAYLYQGGVVEGDLFLYSNEISLVSKIYREILKNGYYTKSKTEEKSIRVRLGKAVSRQTYRKFKKY